MSEGDFWMFHVNSRWISLKSTSPKWFRVHALLTILDAMLGPGENRMELRLDMFVSHSGHSRINIAVVSITPTTKRDSISGSAIFQSNSLLPFCPITIKNAIFKIFRPSRGWFFDFAFPWIFMTSKSHERRKICNWTTEHITYKAMKQSKCFNLTTLNSIFW